MGDTNKHNGITLRKFSNPQIRVFDGSTGKVEDEVNEWINVAPIAIRILDIQFQRTKENLTAEILYEVPLNNTEPKEPQVESKDGEVYIFHNSNYDDYSPVLVMTHKGEILITGDNIHSEHYEEYAQGYAKGSGSELIYVSYNSWEFSFGEAIKYRKLLEKFGYESFLEDIKQYVIN